MFFTGIAIFAGVAALLAKLRRRWMLRALNHDLALDLAVSAITLVVHWGTFSGVMAATIAGLLTSVATSTAKRLFGYIKGDLYYPGLIFVNPVA
jgi:nucleoside permease NupC